MSKSNRGDALSKNDSGRISWIREILPYVILLAAVLLIRIFVLVNAYVPTDSMEDTIPVDSRVMGLKSSYWFEDPQRGDIAVFWAPDLVDTLYVKRVIGTPGDTVEVIQGVVYVNGETLREDYLWEPMMPQDFGPYVVPEGHYFMMGDNRNDSLDSRYWVNTYVPRDEIVGKVYFRYWPSPAWIGSAPDYDALSASE